MINSDINDLSLRNGLKWRVKAPASGLTFTGYNHDFIDKLWEYNWYFTELV